MREVDLQPSTRECFRRWCLHKLHLALGGAAGIADQPPADAALDSHLDHDPAHLTLSLSPTHPNPNPDLDLFLPPVKPCSFNVYRPFYRLKCDFVEFKKKTN